MLYNWIMEEFELELIPLDKIIKRLETDLHLAEKYREDYCSDPYYSKPGRKILLKNRNKYSILHYLLELKKLKEKDDANEQHA